MITNTLPVTAGAKKPPLVKWEEFQRRHPTADEQTEWARRYPNANRLLVTGAINGIIVLDVDAGRGGDQSVRGKQVPPTRVVRTPRGGAHYYFTHPGFHVDTRVDILPGVDVRGDGGYVLVPPSTIDGRAYEVILDAPIAPMPDWLLVLVRHHASGRNGHQSLPQTELTRLLRGVPEGQRDATAARLAGRYLRMRLPESEVLELLRAWNMRNRPPLEDAALRKVVTSITKADSRQRTDRAPITFRAASTLTPRAVQFAWDGRFPLGTLTGFVGVPGLGKSTILSELAARLSRGQLPGDLHGQPSTTIFATAEDSQEATVIPRLSAAGADLSRIHLPDRGTLLLPDNINELGAWVSRVGATVVFLDPLTAHLAGSVNSWRDADIRRTLAPLARLAEDASIAIALVVHLNKSDSPEVFARVGGSIGIVAAVRSLLLAVPDPGDPDGATRLLAHVKHNLGPCAPTLRYRLEARTVSLPKGEIRTSGVAWAGEALYVHAEDLLVRRTVEEQTERQEAADWLREALREGPRGSKELFAEAKRLGFSERTVWRAKKTLDVRAKQTGRTWSWVLP